MKSSIKLIAMLIVSVLSVSTWATPYTVTNQQIANIQVLLTNHGTHVDDEATVIVDIVDEPNYAYTLVVDQGNPISMAIYNTLLSSIATGSSVAFSGVQISCGCAACTREIQTITIE